ncbi:MAG: hypothetical protein A2751_03140 [Candidatus Doudnabacteria bacterium RIFCSPHIGHO2_01_FULL_46_14]|uniref:Uncharacterized protein n=1 Tax=Candidatus Doudnabacteria bacterium RIFCSPHIGHO2_01_FULL_46_14 TaxID=1817824 RepID=A0A1F5NKU6_9BACT|nr:MAG: hypothetical protein A2751_03140 [Candidatus Doudnabacteria bacterium RIFCSPHIGHO2_01_FULL_46_14]
MKWIVVVGALSSFGQPICKRLFDAGFGIYGVGVHLKKDVIYDPAVFSFDRVDITNRDDTAEFFRGIRKKEVAGLVNAARFVPSVSDPVRLNLEVSVRMWETNVQGLAYLVDEFMSSATRNHWPPPLTVVDIADCEQRVGVHPLFSAAMSARRRMGFELAALYQNLRIKTIIRKAEDTPEQIAEAVELLMFGQCKDFIGEYTPTPDSDFATR